MAVQAEYIALQKKDTVTVTAEQLQPKPIRDVYSASASIALMQRRMKARHACNCGGNAWLTVATPLSIFPNWSPSYYSPILLIQSHYESKRERIHAVRDT